MPLSIMHTTLPAALDILAQAVDAPFLQDSPQAASRPLSPTPSDPRSPRGPALRFPVLALFLLGSPLGLFLTSRGQRFA